MQGSDRDGTTGRRRQALRENLARRKGQARALKPDPAGAEDDQERMVTRKRKLDALLKPGQGEPENPGGE